MRQTFESKKLSTPTASIFWVTTLNMMKWTSFENKKKISTGGNYNLHVSTNIFSQMSLYDRYGAQ